MGRFFLLLFGVISIFTLDLVPLNPVDDILLLLLAFSSGVLTEKTLEIFPHHLQKLSNLYVS